ncbi:hypothetical protein [Craterilacuibacter sinensis]|uniref:hypothetical protein n=1 Tax=Craterilacuibacter sinensis TaxID=2686017 RepID=UPI000F5C29A8|nr:hypothetical protein [Craterilacuibacter sinensis]RQW26647.1 hypothetical protein EHS17_09670 [Rhodobacteraceae bacterium CH30]
MDLLLSRIFAWLVWRLAHLLLFTIDEAMVNFGISAPDRADGGARQVKTGYLSATQDKKSCKIRAFL